MSNSTGTFYKPQPPTPGQLLGRQQAFPSVTTAQNGIDYLSAGMTKREQLAALALQGILANPDARKAVLEQLGDVSVTFAKTAVELADALLEELAIHG